MFKNVIFGAVVVLCLLSQTAFGIRNIHANRRAAPQVVDPDEKTSGDDAILVLKKEDRVMKIGIRYAASDPKLKEKIPAILPTIQSHGFTMDSLQPTDLNNFVNGKKKEKSIDAMLNLKERRVEVYEYKGISKNIIDETREIGTQLAVDLSFLARTNPPITSGKSEIGKNQMDYTIKMTKKKDNRAKYYYLT
eukprot:Platyproteum_vivax@DN2507_c0_g1_i2.p1